MNPFMPTPESVGQFYDQFTPFFEIVWGESIHVGYWPEPTSSGSIAEAQVRLTEIMVGKAEIQEGQHMLDVGCGTGEPSIHLARATGCRLTGVSVSPKQIEKARQKAADAKLGERLRFQVANAMALPFPDASFEAAWAFESLFHMSDPGQALREMHRCINPGGQLLIANFTITQPMTAEEEQFYRQVFHSGYILPLKEHQELIRSAGFELEETMDISENVAKTVPLTRDALNARMDEIRQKLPGIPLEMLDTVWRQAIDISTRCVGYALFRARKR
jgi:cyclopropane fatty-acyl-phospholipid synthase-like methyltransferase